MRIWVAGFAVALVHFLITTFFMIASFAETMRRFGEGKGSLGPSFLETISEWAARVLLTPVGVFLRAPAFRGALDYALIYANSLLWGFLLAWLARGYLEPYPHEKKIR